MLLNLFCVLCIKDRFVIIIHKHTILYDKSDFQQESTPLFLKIAALLIPWIQIIFQA